jgi:hypothetical protein
MFICSFVSKAFCLTCTSKYLDDHAVTGYFSGAVCLRCFWERFWRLLRREPPTASSGLLVSHHHGETTGEGDPCKVGTRPPLRSCPLTNDAKTTLQIFNGLFVPTWSYSILFHPVLQSRTCGLRFFIIKKSRKKCPVNCSDADPDSLNLDPDIAFQVNPNPEPGF